MKYPTTIAIDRKTASSGRTARPKATAVVEGGEVVGFEITDPGVGYISTPQIEVAGYPDVQADGGGRIR